MKECFNSPYGHRHFPEYAETIDFDKGSEYEVEGSKSESVRMLSSAAKESGVWLIGGMGTHSTACRPLTYLTERFDTGEGFL
jgi:hypothetical protein